ncbi:hypothetical protein [Achromobacter sp.]|nr:hypothetical protein [Achromobacter sp.]
MASPAEHHAQILASHECRSCGGAFRKQAAPGRVIGKVLLLFLPIDKRI